MTIKQSAWTGMVPVDDTALYVTDTGGRGRPVVYLNGAYADQSHWRRVIADLGSDYRHITYDERARGKSKAAPGTPRGGPRRPRPARSGGRRARRRPYAWALGAPASSGTVVARSSRGRRNAAASPNRLATPSTTIASAYEWFPSTILATRTVPATAVPSVEPRFETARERPEISPCLSSCQLDCTRFTDGVNIRPHPKPIRNSPGANAHGLGLPATTASRTTIPASS